MKGAKEAAQAIALAGLVACNRVDVSYWFFALGAIVFALWLVRYLVGPRA